MLTIEETEILRLLLDCQNCIDRKNMGPKDQKLLTQLEKAGLVALSWRVTPKGMRVMGVEGCQK